jgi:hypothetical protein
MSRSSFICFAIHDQDLRFRALNQTLATTHGVSIEEHIGTSLGDIIGELEVQAKPALQQVLRTGQGLCLETVGRLPSRPTEGSWMNHFFPIATPRGKVRQVGILAVEVTELKALDELYASLTGQLLARANEAEWALVTELQSCIGEYKTALALNLSCAADFSADPERTVELFTHSMQLLDQRIDALSSAVGKLLPR